MKKTTQRFILLALVLGCLSWAGILHGQQQNQKIIFPNPANFQQSAGSFIRPVSDGGYILLGSATSSTPSSYLHLPRAIKLDAELEVEWDHTYLGPPPGQDYVIAEVQSAPLELPDGSFVFSVLDSTSNFDVVRISSTGDFLWGIDLPGFFVLTNPLGVLPNGNILAAHCRFDNVGGCGILHLDPDGNEVFWEEIPELGFIEASAIFPNGEVLTVHPIQGKHIFSRITPQAEVVWQSEPYEQLNGRIAVRPGGGFGALARPTFNTYQVRYFDDLGQPAGESSVISLPIGFVQSLDFYDDGSFLLSGQTFASRGFLARVQADGTVLWSAESPEDGQPHLFGLNGIATPDGWGIGVGSSTDFSFGLLRVGENTGIFVNELTGRVGSDSNDDCSLQNSEPGLPFHRIRATDGTQVFFGFSNTVGGYQMFLPSGDFNLTVQPNDPFFNLCPDEDWQVSFPGGQNNAATLDLPMQQLELIHHISGQVRLDENGDCAVDAGDTPLRHWYVYTQFNGQPIHQLTDADGHYQFFLPSGTYELSIFPYNQYFSLCAPAVQTVTFSGDDPQSAVVDFAVKADTDCAYLRTAIGSAIVRPCEPVVFPVYYWNEGARAAEDVAVEVTLPAGLSYVSASPAPVSANGGVLRFEFGQVPADPGGAWHLIEISTTADCSLQIGDQVCLSAQVTPAEICGDAPGWNGAVVSLDGECVGDSAVFTIKNIGNAPNSQLLEYLIVEDQIVLLQGTFQLDPLDELIRAVLPSNDSSTVVMTAQQEPGFPGDPVVTFTLSGCAGFGSNSSGFGGNPGPFSANLCLPVRNSYDPNDKQAFPLGFGEEHIVRPGTPLDYTIRFQNTGNDTAFAVVLRDTLSAHLDHGRIELLGSSHRFEAALLGEGVLHFNFPGIMLPDSTTNPAGSQGYVSFRVYPLADLPLGTVIENRAAIYFDYNPPIITNTVSRKYQEFTVVQTRELPGSPSLELQVFPNPFTEKATFSLPAEAPEAPYFLEVFDALGRRLHHAPFNGRQYELSSNGLPSGLLFWRVWANGQVVASGKIIGG